MSIIKTFIFTLLFTLSFPAHSPAPQLGSDDSLSPSLSPPAPSPSPESDLTPPPSSPLTPSPENVKSVERKEAVSGGKKERIVVGVVAALSMVGLGYFGGVVYDYLINQPNPQGNMADNHGINQQNLGNVFVMGRRNNVYEYTLIDNTFPENREILNPPDPLPSLINIRILDTIFGYLCFLGEDVDANKWAVMWDPIDGHCIPFDVNPNEGYTHTVVAFGVCHVNGLAHAGIVKISVMENFDGRPPMWDVDVFRLTIGEPEWLNVHTDMRPFRSCRMESAKVCVNGVIYFRAFEGPIGNRENFFISLDLERMKFGEVPLPRSLVNTTNFIQSVKLNGSLGLLEYHDGVCDVWTKREGANDTFFWRICNYFGVNETFTKIRTIRVEGHPLGAGSVLGFRNNGDVIIELAVNNEESRIVVYEQHIRDVGIQGRQDEFFARQL